MFLGFLDFGTGEIFVILVVALVLFGPRKLPQLSRSLGRSLSEFRRASMEFKQTWEQEVAVEEANREARIERVLPPQDNSIAGSTVERSRATKLAATEDAPETNAALTPAPPASAPDSSAVAAAPPAPVSSPVDAPSSEPLRKRDWL